MKQTIRDIQMAALEILLDFVKLCDENGLCYYLSDGTLLGAVRHDGFIPWDDDVDVSMPREDFERFLTVADTQLPSKYVLNHFSKQQDSPWYVPKIENPEIKLISRVAIREKSVKIWIDVFPLDGMPDMQPAKLVHAIRLTVLRGLYKLSLFRELVDYRNTNRPWYENIVIRMALLIDIERFVNAQKAMKRLDRALKKYTYHTSKQVLSFMGAYKFKSVMNRNLVYGKGMSYSFEGHTFRGPADAQAYLTALYGDYMAYPPEGERNRHRTYLLEEKNAEGEGVS